MFMPFVPEGHYSIYMACICWSVTEVTRFTLYALKNAGVDMTFNTFADLVSHARYNFFIVLYPVGITGELLCCFKTWQYFKNLPQGAERPWWSSYPLPNRYNFSFNYEDAIFWIIPTLYILFFPGLYMHMWGQRAKHYKARNHEISTAFLRVPDKFKTFIPIHSLQKLWYPEGEKVNPMVLTNQSIEHKRGDVLLIDFWATWCPPCQRPMAHNQEMMVKYGPQWRDKQTGRRVRIIGLSIDNAVSKMSSHVTSKGWTDVENYIITDQKPMKNYDVQGVPHIMLVDQYGKVVFKGHPGHRRDIAGDLNKLFRGIPLN